MTGPDYRQQQYGLTLGQLEAIARLRGMAAWHQRKFCKTMRGGPRGALIYKYMAFEPANPLGMKKARDLIVDSRLYLSAPSDFNDPYDFRARITVSNDRAGLRAHFEKSARRHLDEVGDPIPEVRGRNRKIETLVARAMSKLTSNPNAVAEAFERARDNNGVACFSGDPRGLLMWAHYAAGHTGICLQFDVTRDPGVLMISHRVTYRDNLPTIEYPNFDDLVDKVIVNKGRAWEAEEEVRYVSMTTVRNSLPFDGRALVAIILGLRFPSRHLEDLKRLVDDRVKVGLKAPVVYQAHQKATSYGIEIKRLRTF